MGEPLLYGATSGLLAFAQVLAAFRIGHRRCPLTCLWTIANGIFCLPVSVGLMISSDSGLSPTTAQGAVYYSLTALCISMSMAACELIIWSRFTQPPTLARYIARLILIRPRNIVFTLAMVWVIRVIALVGYGIFFSGTRNLSTLDSSLPSMMALLLVISDMAGYAIFYWGSTRLFASSRGIPLLPLPILICVTELSYTLMTGRRWTLMLVTIVFLAWWLIRRPGWRKLTLAVGAASTVTYAIFIIFISLRIGTYQDRPNGKPSDLESVGTIFSKGLDALLSGNSFNALDENLRSRPYNIYDFSGSIAITHAPPMMGEALKTSLMWATPSGLVDKTDLLQTEQAIQKNYGFVDEDTASSWAAFAFADFGILGGLIYGTLVATLLSLFHKAASALKSPLLDGLIGATLILCLFQIEQDITTTLATVRNIACVVALAWMIRLFTKNRTDELTAIRTSSPNLSSVSAPRTTAQRAPTSKAAPRD